MSEDQAFKKVSKTGRVSVISPEIIKKIYQILLTGAYIETAAAFCSVNKQTLYTWMKKGNEEPDSIYGEFLDAVSRAIAESEIRDLTVVDKAAMGQDWEYERHPDGTVDEYGKSIAGQLVLNGRGNPIPKKIGHSPNWAASAWRLERKHPKRWAVTQKLEHSGKEGAPQIIVELPSNGREVREFIDTKKDDDGTPEDQA